MIESVESTHVSRAAAITVGSTLDFRSADQFRKVCESLHQRGYRYFALNLSKTGVMDSSGLGAIFTLHKQLAPIGGRILFVAPSRFVESLMELTKCDQLFGNYPSVERALEELLQPRKAAKVGLSEQQEEREAITSYATEDLSSDRAAQAGHDDVIPAANAAASAVPGDDPPLVEEDGADRPEDPTWSGSTNLWGSGDSDEVEELHEALVPEDEQSTSVDLSPQDRTEEAEVDAAAGAASSNAFTKKIIFHVEHVEPGPDASPVDYNAGGTTKGAFDAPKLDELLRLAREYHLISRYARDGNHVHMQLLEGAQPVEMYSADAEEFLSGLLTGMLPPE